MSAHLKKRALAEYAHTVLQDEGPRPAKQLHLSSRSSSSSSSKSRSTDQLLSGTAAAVAAVGTTTPCGYWNPACLSDPDNTAVMAGLLTLRYALPLQEDLEREVVDGLLALLFTLSSATSSGGGGESSGDDGEPPLPLPQDTGDLQQPSPSDTTGGSSCGSGAVGAGVGGSSGGGVGTVTKQDVLAQVVAVLPDVVTTGHRVVDVQRVSAVVDALVKVASQWLQTEQQKQLLLSQHVALAPDYPTSSTTTLPKHRGPGSRVLAQAVKAAYTLALHSPALPHATTPTHITTRQQVLSLALACLELHHHHLVKVNCLEAAGGLCGGLDPSTAATMATDAHSTAATSIPHITASPTTTITSSNITAGDATSQRWREVSLKIRAPAVSAALLRHTNHHDNRVRTAAFRAMVVCGGVGGARLPEEAYPLVCEALDDDYQRVREAAIDLITVIAVSDGERLLPPSRPSQEPERLADHAFYRICGCLNDCCVRVRSRAASALSGIPAVSQHALLQTLDKKLFSNMRRKLSYHERQAQLVSSGEWSRGRGWGEDRAHETMTPEHAEHTSLIHSAGAFVHGLEDECLEVRSASLDAMCLLAEGSQVFAVHCLDFLVDMFNDEICDVRLKAVKVLQRIVAHIRLQEDQLDEILHALKDSWQRIREGVHKLIGSCTFTTTACLQATVAALMDNIRRYPQDVLSIQQCMVQLGQRQSGLVAGLVPQLLLTHPYFDAVQPSLHQPSYICKLLLVLNAAAHVPTILPLLEEHTLSHYAYLRDTLPHHVPLLKMSGRSNAAISDVRSNTEEFLQQSLAKLRRLDRASTQLRLTLYSSVYGDLQKLSALDPTMSASAEFAALYTRCTLLLTRLLNCPGWLQQESSGSNVQQLVTLTFRLVHAFTGLAPLDRACARGIRLRALALQLVYVVNGSTGSALGLCEAFLNNAKPLRDSNNLLYSEEKKMSTDSSSETFEDSFLTVALNQLKDERRPGTVARTLQPLLSAHPPMPLPPMVNPRAIHQASAKINEPNPDSDAIHKLTAGLLLAIPLDAQLYHIPDSTAVRIRISYPDQSVQYVVPRPNHLQSTDKPNCYRLQTTVLLTAGVWSEACQVQLSLVLDLSPAGPKRKHDPHTIDLSEPTSLMLWPKPMKKGI